MRSFKPLLTNCFVLCLQSYLVLGQNVNSEWVEKLDQAGFGNLRTLTNGRTLKLSYENNLYSEKATAFKEVLNSVADFGYDTIQIITLVNDLPVIITQLSTSPWQQYRIGQLSAADMVRQVSLTYNTCQAWKLLRTNIPVNPSVNKIDLVIYPQIYLMNVVFSQIYEIQFNIAPALEVSLWRGMKFTGQVILPVFNDKLYGTEGDRVRTGFLTLAQEFRLPGNIMGRAVIGKFNAGRYGADLTLTHYFFRGKAYLGANTGLTGTHRFYGNRWYRDI